MKFGTKTIHAGQHADLSTGAIMTPIYQTSTYIQAKPGEHKGYEYSRTANPTRTALEKNIAALENGNYGLCFGSGLAAIDCIIKLLKPGDEVIYRDLNDEMVFVSGLTESGMNIDEKDQNENHKKMFKLSDQLVKELKESDIIIISAPIYNYGPPATLKAWSDLAARVGETFRFKPNGRREGLLKNKKAYLVITSGGTKLNSSEDFLTPWLKFILNFFGIEKIDIICNDN